MLKTSTDWPLLFTVSKFRTFTAVGGPSDSEVAAARFGVTIEGGPGCVEGSGGNGGATGGEEMPHPGSDNPGDVSGDDSGIDSGDVSGDISGDDSGENVGSSGSKLSNVAVDSGNAIELAANIGALAVGVPSSNLQPTEVVSPKKKKRDRKPTHSDVVRKIRRRVEGMRDVDNRRVTASGRGRVPTSSLENPLVTDHSALQSPTVSLSVPSMEEVDNLDVQTTTESDDREEVHVVDPLMLQTPVQDEHTVNIGDIHDLPTPSESYPAGELICQTPVVAGADHVGLIETPLVDREITPPRANGLTPYGVDQGTPYGVAEHTPSGVVAGVTPSVVVAGVTPSGANVIGPDHADVDDIDGPDHVEAPYGLETRELLCTFDTHIAHSIWHAAGGIPVLRILRSCTVPSQMSLATYLIPLDWDENSWYSVVAESCLTKLHDDMYFGNVDHILISAFVEHWHLRPTASTFLWGK